LLGGTRVDATDRAPASGGALVVLEDDLAEVEDGFGADASFFLYLGSRLPPGAREADAVFPIGTFSEMDGTFTNFEGRVQRFHQALEPPGIARPAWMVLSRLLSASGEGDPVDDAASAFDVVSSGAPAFSGLSWTGLGLHGVVAAGEPATVGTAGDTEADG
jgi:predicted molibdopterin-dependent oxidoreductase YjgC